MLTREKIYAISGSVIGCLILFLILWFVYMPMTHSDNVLDEGVMISFGDSQDGGGNDMNVKDVYTPPVESQAPTKNSQKLPTEQELMTQKTPSALKINDQKKDTKNTKNEVNVQQQAEVRKATEQKNKEQAAISKANDAMAGLFGNSGGKGSGNTQGDSHQGNPAGKGTSGGNSWSLNGRDLVGTLVRPAYSSNEEGKITVTIRVDKFGNVTSASIGSPTTISDGSTRNGAITAARQTKFSGGSGVVMGSITYFYKLN